MIYIFIKIFENAQVYESNSAVCDWQDSNSICELVSLIGEWEVWGDEKEEKSFNTSSNIFQAAEFFIILLKNELYL